jgi:hypothetical protein
MALDAVNGFLYVTQGGNTNLGGPSLKFSLLPEYALSSAILRIDLNAIGSTTYNLPTLDDEGRPGASDANDPFGGNDGKNQAKLVPGGPVQVYASGFRNPYDVVITEAGRMYSIDNGSNAGWGNIPIMEGPQGNCTNGTSEPGFTEKDGLQFITGLGFYGGHPNPTRGNVQNKFNSSNPQSPVQQSNAVECDHRAPGAVDGSLVLYSTSTNGLAEYTASNFGGALKGDLLSVSHAKSLNRVKLTADGAGVQIASQLDNNLGSTPLDVTALGDSGPFPGTIWVADHALGKIFVFEPNDYSGSSGNSCSGANNAQLDEDDDGFSNTDEIANGTNPCSAADTPSDADADFVSDLLDPDDDNDQLPDAADPFPIDGGNGRATNLPVVFTWDNDEVARGGLLDLGFTGLMTNGSQNYQTMFNADDLTAGGAAGVFTVDQLTQGDALNGLNTQQNAFQFGINVLPSSPKFTLHTQIAAPFAGVTPEGEQSMGLFFGTGDQDNYVKLVLSAAGGTSAVQTGTEISGAYQLATQDALVLPGPDSVDLYLEIDPSNATAQASYEVTTAGTTSPRLNLGLPQNLNALWFSSPLGPAVGVISTGRGGSGEVSATWDFFEVLITGTVLSDGRADVSITPNAAINASTYNSGSFQITNNSTAGSEITEISFNLLGSFLEGIVFDPNGQAGDPVAKVFTPDSSSSVGLTGHSFFGPRDGGFDGLTTTFSDFDPGETFTFSVDIDPTSIKGAPAPGPNESGSVSGLELSGGTVTVAFDDGTQLTAEIFAQLGSAGGGVSTVKPGLPAEPVLEIVGFGPSPQVTNSAQQMVRIIASPNATVRLLRAEGGAFTAGVPSGAPELGEFEANSIVAVQQTTLVTNSSGIVEVPVALTASNANAGLNFFLAAEVQADGSTGLVSAPFVVEFVP